ncbi:MAG TPA: S8 family serine peptidase [Xanthobacteraceae bacterium]|nr:S8 family serine peptidase [Xanthobacteraceae bacterium]
MSRWTGNHLVRAAALAAACLCGYTATGHNAAAQSFSRDEPITVRMDGPPAERAAASAALLAKARRKPHIRVTVGVRMNLEHEDRLSAAQARAQADAQRRLEDGVLRRAFGARIPDRVVRYPGFIPFVTLNVGAREVERLLSDPAVSSIEEPVAAIRGSTSALTSAALLIKALGVWTQGFRGSGWHMAILDTGVAPAHPALSGKVAAQACYSTHDPADSKSSLCPGHLQEVIERDSANASKYCRIQGCEHGTGVAHIATAVAPHAKIIAMQVHTKVADHLQCVAAGLTETPCVIAYSDDIRLALFRVYTLRFLRIAAVNLSIHARAFRAHCDSWVPSVTSAVNKVHQAEIAVVSISGNDGRDGVNSWPGCISNVISVGGTVTTAELDRAWSGSNLSPLTDLMAPGFDLIVAKSPSGTVVTNGTSFAAPHVSGAFALMKGMRANRPVGATTAPPKISEILAALECTGKPVTRAGVTKPRIDLFAAHDFLTKVNRANLWDVSNAIVPESASSTSLTVKRSCAAALQTVYVSTAESENSSNQGDFVTIPKTAITFAPGVLSRPVKVTVNPDTTDEGDETFALIVQKNASDPVTTYLAKGTFTIVDDDSPPPETWTMAGAIVNENAGVANIAISRPGLLPAQTVFLNATTCGYANVGDFTPPDPSVAFASGQTETTVPISIGDDLIHEETEVFCLELRDAGSTLLASGSFMIFDNDPAD